MGWNRGPDGYRVKGLGAVRVTESNGLAGLNEHFCVYCKHDWKLLECQNYLCMLRGCVEGLRNQPSLVSAEWACMYPWLPGS